MTPSGSQHFQPLRFRQLLDKCRDQFWAVVGNQFSELLDNTDKAFIDFADNAESDAIREVFFEAMGAVHNQRHDIERVFQNDFKRAFDAIGTALNRPFPGAGNDLEMALLEYDEMEEAVAVENLIARAGDDYFSELYALTQRLALLNGGRLPKPEQLPTGPHHLVRAFRSAVSRVGGGSRIEMVLLVLLDKFIISRTGDTYLQFNETLKAAGILPNLKHVINPHKAASRPGGAAEKDAAEGTDKGTSTEPQVNLGEELFGSILQLMAARRGARSPSGPGAGAGVPGVVGSGAPIPQATLVSTIGTLQTQSIEAYGDVFSDPDAVSSLGRDPRFVEKARQNLTDERRQLYRQVKPERMTGLDADIIDVVGLLFEYMLNDPALPNVAKAMISRLHTPYLKVAIIDRELLVDSEHPARELLDLMVDAGSQYVDETDSTRGVFPQLSRVVERVLKEFVDDIGLFREVLADLRAAVEDQKRMITSLERRAQQAAKGQEMLQVAQLKAAQSMQERTRKPFLPPEAVSFLGQAWKDRLVFILLREHEGEASAAWAGAVAAADDLVRMFEPGVSALDRYELESALPPLRAALEQGLESLGHSLPPTWRPLDALLADVERLMSWKAGQGEKAEAVPEATQLSREPKASEPHASDEPSAVAGPDAPSPAAPSVPADVEVEAATSPREEAMMRKLMALEFGTWFRFHPDKEGDLPKTLKLSWHSPVTHACMFVDRDGVKADILTVQALAREMLAGRVTVIEREKRPFVERALEYIQQGLRKLAMS